ncbi:hypothetical protein [Janthinobacterium sp. CG3]|uniref:hypothetical protein n=1 Tax=Janthinobacterium sp. CG3 TaxID=1075768 RepID=UPI003FA53FF2
MDAEPRHGSACATSGGMTVDGVEEGLMAVVEFDNGTLVQVRDTYNAPHSLSGIEIIGSKGSISSPAAC